MITTGRSYVAVVRFLNCALPMRFFEKRRVFQRGIKQSVCPETGPAEAEFARVRVILKASLSTMFSNTTRRAIEACRRRGTR